MGNPNPWKARQAKARKRLKNMTAGDIKDAKAALWLVITEGMERIDLLQDGDHTDFCRVANSLTGAVREFRSLIETSEIEERVAQIERNQSKPAWRGATA